MVLLGYFGRSITLEPINYLKLFRIFEKIIEWVDRFCLKPVTDILVKNNGVQGIVCLKGRPILANKMILALDILRDILNY
jgi:hypothetical protein